MQIYVNGKGVELCTSLQDEIKLKVERAFDRFSRRIGKVNAFLEDVNGPRRGFDKSMRLVIDVERIPLVVMEHRGESWRALIDETVERAVYTVSRQIERFRSRSHRVRKERDPEVI
jgi:ribosome-associated translation inhibitor RaiA